MCIAQPASPVYMQPAEEKQERRGGHSQGWVCNQEMGVCCLPASTPGIMDGGFDQSRIPKSSAGLSVADCLPTGWLP